MRRACWMLMGLAIVSGCAHDKTQQLRPGQMVPIEDHGTLVSIDQTLGMGTIDIKGEVVNFWWNNRSQKPGTEAHPELQVTPVPFNAEPGDTIYFKGFQSRNEIFFTAAAAVRK